MLNKNQIIELKIEDITNLGFGVGKHMGQVVFIAGTVPEDVVLAKIIKAAKSYCIGRVERYIKRSDLRTDTRCGTSGCRSCAYRELEYAHEIELKGEIIRNAFRKEGLTDITLDSVTPSPALTCYRNKAQYPISRTPNGGYAIGFYAPKSHRVTEAAHCPLAPTVFGEILELLRDYFCECKLSVYNEETGEGLLRHVYLRRGELSGEILVTLVINGTSIPKSEKLVRLITERIPSVVGILLNENREDTNVVLGNKYFTLYGRDYIFDTLAGVELKITAPSFYQVNHGATELLYAKAKELAGLKKSDTLLDLFCGAGSIGLSMVEDCRELIGIEIVESAVECAKENAARNGAKNASFFAGDASDTEKLLSIAEGELGKKIKPNVIILDPPRAGCDSRLVSFTASLAPDRIVYISCNPATLARDVKLFREYGYTSDTVYGFDLFPMTGHVESLVCLTKQTN